MGSWGCPSACLRMTEKMRARTLKEAHMKKRVLSLFMALALCLTMLPTAAFAETSDAAAQTAGGTTDTGGAYTIDKDTAHMKSKLAVDFADLVYNGKWFTPLREALTAFAVDTQKHVTGTVKLKLYKGNIITASVTSPETLYSEDLVTFEESDYDQKDAQGFINLWGLPDTVQALRDQGKLK